MPESYVASWEMWAWQSATACHIVDAAAELTSPAEMVEIADRYANSPDPLTGLDFFSEVDAAFSEANLAAPVDGPTAGTATEAFGAALEQAGITREDPDSAIFADGFESGDVGSWSE